MFFFFYPQSFLLTMFFFSFFFLKFFFFLSWGGYLCSFSNEILSLFFLVMMISSLGWSSMEKMKNFLKIILIFSFLFFLCETFLIMYFSLEMLIIPISFMILFWGVQPEKISAFYYFSFYTILSSFPFCIFLSFFYDNMNMFSFMNFSTFFLFCCSFVFVVKLPLYIVHLWLPKAHGESPTIGSVILAGLMLKLGSYGLTLILKCFLNIFLVFFFFFSFLGGLSSSFVASFQSDIKVLVAFSSVTHMNFMFAVLLFFSSFVKLSSFLMMLTHGIISSLMFWMAGLIYHESLTRKIFFLKSLQKKFFSFFFILVISNFSFPPLLSFFQEMIFFWSLMSYSMLFFFFSCFMIFFLMFYNIFLNSNFLMKNKLLIYFFILDYNLINIINMLMINILFLQFFF